jgi:hypothetical protein
VQLKLLARLHLGFPFFNSTVSQYIDTSLFVRLGVFSLTTIWLLVAAYNFVTARFADILRDQITAGLNESDSPILYNAFQKLMIDFRKAMAIVALSSALFSLFGLTLLAHPSQVREGRTAFDNFFLTQLLFGVVVLALGGYIMDQMHGFLDVFAAFDGRGSLPRCSIIYHGAIGQIVLGILVVLTSLISLWYLFRIRQQGICAGYAGRVQARGRQEIDPRIRLDSCSYDEIKE